jgi:hypothetical protein
VVELRHAGDSAAARRRAGFGRADAANSEWQTRPIGHLGAECGVYGLDACFTRSAFFDLARDLKPEDVQMTPWAAAIQAQRAGRDHVDDSPGVPRIDYGGGPFKILQTPGVTAFLYETLVGMIFRQALTDRRALPTAADPTWLGNSVGRWDGDAFVVDTNGLRDGGWIDTAKAHPHSDALHVTERFHRKDFGHMDLAITIDDPKAYLKPWTATVKLHLLPDTELIEAFCDDHQRTMLHRSVTPAPPEPHSPPLAK